MLMLHDVCRGKDPTKRFCELFREHTMQIINFKKKNIKLLNEWQESLENAKIFYICKGKLEGEYAKDKKYRKVRDHCHYTGEYRGAACRVCNSEYS